MKFLLNTDSSEHKLSQSFLIFHLVKIGALAHIVFQK